MPFGDMTPMYQIGLSQYDSVICQLEKQPCMTTTSLNESCCLLASRDDIHVSFHLNNSELLTTSNRRASSQDIFTL